MYPHLKDLFYLNEEITFLNFGSFGASPKPIIAEYHRLQLEMERDPVQFIVHKGAKYLERSREVLGNYINCAKEDVVYVTNPSFAVNMIAKNLDLKEGDEILSTDLEYGACDRTFNYYCNTNGAKYIRQKINLPIVSKEQFLNDFFEGITPKTKLIFTSHITSSTALKLPVEEVCKKANELGIPVFIDGAHAPGHVPLDMQALNVDYYTGACHKWMMAPKGNSFLYVKKEHQKGLDPLVVSWGYEALFPSNSQFIDYHQFNGTRDYTAFLCTEKCIEFMEEHNWSQVSKDCKNLVRANAQEFANICNSELLAPLDNDFFVQMCAVQIHTNEPEKLYRHIVDNYKVELPISRHGDKNYIRYSINGFNSQSDLDRLFEVLDDVKNKSGFINK